MNKKLMTNTWWYRCGFDCWWNCGSCLICKHTGFYPGTFFFGGGELPPNFGTSPKKFWPGL